MTLALAVASIALFLGAAVTDVTSRRIPNQLVAALAFLGLLRVGLDLAAVGAGTAAWTAAWTAAATDLGLALGVLGIGAVLFHFELLGGGDVKLLAAGALFVGVQAAWVFFAATAIAGGALAIVFAAWMTIAGRSAGRPSLPYGMAIAAGGLVAVLAGI